jgi:8-oxo-dGTP diphosphatase
MSRPGVGIAVLITDPLHHPGEVLLGQRRGSTGPGTFALPGGHLERFESFEVCAAREALEETNLGIVDLEQVAIDNCFVEAKDYHYVCVYVLGVVDHSGGELKVRACMYLCVCVCVCARVYCVNAV